MPRRKKPRGRPPQHALPELLDASPETVAAVALRARPEAVWRHAPEADRERRRKPA